MDINELVKLVPPAYIYTVAGILASGLLGLSAYVGKTFMKKRKQIRDQVLADIATTKNALVAVQDELALQRTNCLHTLQGQGDRQIELLTELVKGQAHQSGVLEGFLKLK